MMRERNLLALVVDGRRSELEAISAPQVVKEVAVLDNINPGGLYAARVKLLGRCTSAHLIPHNTLVALHLNNGSKVLSRAPVDVL